MTFKNNCSKIRKPRKNNGFASLVEMPIEKRPHRLRKPFAMFFYVFAMFSQIEKITLLMFSTFRVYPKELLKMYVNVP